MKKWIALGLALASAAAVSSRRNSRRESVLSRFFPVRENSAARVAAEKTAHRYMMYFIMPAWSLFGALDWLWHRQTKIESTSGPQGVHHAPSHDG